MQKYRILLLLFCFQITYSQDINFEWKKLIGQVGINEINCMLADTDNNIIVGGFFENTINIEGVSITSNGNKDYLLAKYDSSGNNIWVLHGGGHLDDYISDITFLNNRLFVLGVFSDTLHFADDFFIADSLTDLFIGELINDKIYGIDKFSGNGEVKAEKIVTDKENLYITGGYKGEFIAGNDTLISTGVWDILWPGTDSIYRYTEHLFLINYNLQDKIKWYKNYKNARGLSMAIDSSNNIYLIAYHYMPCIIENGIEITNNLFLVKLDNNGNYLWHITGGPTGQITQPYDLVFSENYLYITGDISGNNLYIDGNENIVETSWYDAFLCKMDTTGSLIWFKQIGVGSWRDNIGPHNNYGNAIFMNKDTILMTGHFLGGIDFGQVILNSQGAHDLFYAKYLTDGSFMEAGQYIVMSFSSANDITTDEKGNIYIAGYSYENNTSDIKPQFILFGKIESISNKNIYITEQNANDDVIIYPNPTTSTLNIIFNMESDRNIYIYNPLGITVFTSSSNNREIAMNISNLNVGLYLIVVNENNRLIKRKFLKE